MLERPLSGATMEGLLSPFRNGQSPPTQIRSYAVGWVRFEYSQVSTADRKASRAERGIGAANGRTD